jgi:putative flippase GtrA
MKFAIHFIRDNKIIIQKYMAVGLSSTVIDFGILFILTDFFYVHYLVSATIAFILAAFYNYFLNRSWTFRSNGKKRKQLPVFFIIATLGILLNNNVMYFSVEQLGLWYIYGKIIATGIVTFWNFFGNKYLTFKI